MQWSPFVTSVCTRVGDLVRITSYGGTGQVEVPLAGECRYLLIRDGIGSRPGRFAVKKSRQVGSRTL